MNKKQKVKYPDIGEELVNLMEEDQKIAKKMRIKDEESRNLQEKFYQLNKKHRKRLKEIIENIGWPTISKVDKKGAQAAWLIAQHSDKDIVFQKECLSLMKDNKDDVSDISLAYLKDRVLKNQDKKQIYGTQLRKDEEGNLEPYPIKNKEEVDKRRSEIGLESLSDYIETVKEKQS